MRLDLSSFEPRGQAVNDWDAAIRGATLDAQGQPLGGGEQAGLEFCVQPPRIWHSDAEGHLTLRCIGWALSHRGEALRLRLSDNSGVRKWLRPVRSRPDVVQHYQRRNIEVTEYSGYDVLLELDLSQGGGNLVLDIFADTESSGALRIDVEQLYRDHRTALGHDEPYLGVFEPTPDTRGRLDEAAGERVRGWAQSLSSAEPVTVVLSVNDEVMAEAAADHYREDLVRMRISESGHSAFEFSLPRALVRGDVVRVEVRDGEELTNSPLVID